jgi:long-chain acyl-CoA synthetase
MIWQGLSMWTPLGETMSEAIVSGARGRSHAALAERAARAATGLERLGVRAGDAVALLLRNDLAFLEASVAAGLLGAYPVPINWHLAADEVAYILADCGARVLVAHADLLAAVEGRVPEGMAVRVAPVPEEIQAAYGLSAAACALPRGAEDWDAWLEAQPPRPPAPVEAPSAMIYTGGTTGRPKGVRRAQPSAEQGAAMTQVLTAIFDLRPGMRTVIAGPLYHSAPNAYAIAALKLGAHLVLQPRFDAEGLLALIEQHRITHFYAVPTMFVRLLRLPEAVRRRHDLSSLRWVIHAAAPCPPEVKRAMIQWWGPVIHEFYGSTEMSAMTVCDSAEALARPGTVGRLLPGAVAHILDEEGRALPPGAVGELHGRQPAITDFTYHGLDDKRRDIERDGLVTVGDLGYFDADGYLFLCDRRIDMIISGGVNIYPAEIEAALIDMPGVADCAVFGIPDAEYGEAVAAAVEPLPGARFGPEDVRRFLRERIAGYKVPRTVELRERLPRLESGKLLKRRLREPYWAEAGRAI